VGAVRIEASQGDRRPVRITCDGDAIDAYEGEPVALSLIAGGVDVVARSTKFHRPRGPFCFVGRCEGCLVRLDGVPNVASCRVAAKDGMKVERQNAFPSADADLLRTVDWFFRTGMDHHEFMAWLPEPLHTAMRATARRVSGLGLLPEAVGSPRPTTERVVAEVVIVGAGPAGLAAAAETATAGRSTVVFDENDVPGGHLLGDPDPDAPARAARLADTARAAGAGIRLGVRVIAFYDGERMIAATDSGLVDVVARSVVIATGTHPQTMLYPGNDLPGTVAAGAAVANARRWGVLPGKKIAVVGEPDLAAPVARCLTDLKANVVLGFGEGTKVVRARGRKRVAGVVISKDGREETVACDAIVVASRGAPAFELAQQGGCAVEFRPEAGFVVTTSTARVRAIGEVAA